MLTTRKTKLAVDKFENETIIVDFETGIYYSLRGSACFIWECCENGLDDQSIKSMFTNLSDDQEIQISTFVKELRDANLIVKTDEKEHSDPSPQDFTEILFEQYKDMEELIMLDPIHEVDEKGWPHKKA